MKKCLFLLILLQTQAYALVVKPYNGQFVFADFNRQSFNFGMLEFGYGYFKSFRKGYEISAGYKLFDAYIDQASNMKDMSLRFNKFFRKTTGHRSSSLGYKIGLAYTRRSCFYSDVSYSIAENDYTKSNTTYRSDLLTANLEAFYNCRLTARCYLELGLGLSNGLEHVKYLGGEIKNILPTSHFAAIWYDTGPGNYYRSFFTAHLRLLGAFGKAKRELNE